MKPAVRRHRPSTHELAPAEVPPEEIARAVTEGLSADPKSLPPWLFYDAVGSQLFETITELDEYYPTRAERSIFELHGDAIVEAALAGGEATWVELGAGSASKTEVLLRAAVRARGRAHYVPIDVSPAALELARARLGERIPAVEVEPWATTHERAFPRLPEIAGRKVVLFIGSSIGNYEPADAVALLAGLRAGLSVGDALLLGTDLRKDPAILVPAYDDARGVTAAFNKNVLTRINRELGGSFDLARFRHVALWNAEASRIEMHLESIGDQVVAIEQLGLRVQLRDCERIHTESSVKYDDDTVDVMLRGAGFERVHRWRDPGARFAEYLATAAPTG